jgi:3-hydroxybutyrate dehydrogenase/3-oxoacyl-[acyl-carrier protein] reductase
VAELSDEAWNEALNWMLNATFWATRRALRDMIPRQWGRIINISSVEGKRVNKPSVAHYVVNKHAIHGLTKAVALEYGSLGITCNAICPGAVETDLMKTRGPEAAAASGQSYEQFLASYAQEAATRRLTTVDEVAAMALLLVSGQGRGITGAIIDVHGGTVL